MAETGEGSAGVAARTAAGTLLRSALVGDLAAALVVLLGGGVLGGGVLGGGMFGGGLLGSLGPAREGGFFEGPARSLVEGGPPPMPLGFELAALALLLVPAALMFARRRWPLAVFAAAFACVVVGVVFAVPAFAAGIALAIAAYSVGFREPRRTVLVVAVITAGLLLALSALSTGGSLFEPRIFQYAAAVLIAAALGDSARSRNEYLIAATERAERAEQSREAEARRRVSEERLRIARDLHDTVAHQISVISLNAGVASGAVRERPERAEEALAAIRSASRGVLAEIGELLRYLRADEAAAPPQPGWERVAELVDAMRDAGLRIELDLDADLDAGNGSGGSTAVPETTGLVAYRIVQEGLTNAHKHGSGSRASVRATIENGANGANGAGGANDRPRELRLRIENPVAPQGAAPGPGSHGLGLIGLRERAAAIGGSLDAARRGDRFVLDAALPLPRSEEPPPAPARDPGAAQADPSSSPSPDTAPEAPR